MKTGKFTLRKYGKFTDASGNLYQVEEPSIKFWLPNQATIYDCTREKLMTMVISDIEQKLASGEWKYD